MKKHYTLFFVFLLFILSFEVFGQITTVPSATGGTVSICQNGSVVFSSTNTPPAGATVSWSFPGGTPSTANSIGPHPVSYTSPGSYVATLNIDGAVSTVNINVAANSNVPTVTTTQTMQQTGGGQTGDTLYYCGNLAGPYNGAFVFFQLNVASYPANNQILVNWGDGSSNVYAGNVGQIQHTYNCTSQTIFNASVSVTGPNGCVAAGVYVIYSGIAPQISVSGNSGTHCMPAPYNFIFNTNDIPGTIYKYDFLPLAPNYPPGAPLGPFPIPGPFPDTIEHIFYEGSCELLAVITGQSYINAYAGNITGTNVCGTTFLSIGPIYVSNAPVAEITVLPTDGFACVEQTVNIVNNSTPGLMVGPPNPPSNPTGCNDLNKWCWSITPSVGWDLVNGDMGDCSNPNWVAWPDASMTLDVTFNQYGTYYIELIQANGCGTHSVIDSICIVAPIEANFTTDVLSGCTPLEINTTNLAYVPSCINNDAVYNWSVSPQPVVSCPVGTAQPSFLNGTTANSQEPTFLFNNPGIYELQLTSTLTNPIPNTLCDNDVQSVLINVLQSPNISFNDYEVCQNNSISLTNTVQECYSTPVYAWTLPGASTPTSSTPVPNVTYSTDGTYPIDVVITNECGSGTFSSNIIVHPSVIVDISGDNAACVNSVLNLTATIVGPATSGTWSVSPNVAGLVPSGLNATFTPPLNYTGTLTFSFVTTNAPAVCGQITATHVVVYDLDATANAGPDLSVCQNGSVNLNGIIGGSASSLTWTSNNAGATFSDVNSPTATFTPPANFLGQITVTLTTDDPPGVCQLATDQLVVTVVAPPTLTVNTLNEVCQGGTLDVSAVVTGTQNGVSWSSPNGVFNPTTGLNTIFTASPVTFFGTTQITATTTGSAPCPAATQTIPITVTPVPTVSFSLADQTICSGDDTDEVTLSSTTSGVAISWAMTVPNGVTGLGAAGSTQTGGTTIPDFTNLVNTTNPPLPVDIVFNAQAIAPGAGNCPTITTQHTITVVPNSIVNPVSNQLVCNGAEVQPIVFSGTGTDYSWVVTSPLPIGLINDTALATPSFFAINTSNQPVTANVAVTSIFSGNSLDCPGLTTNFSITVNPSGQVNSLSDTTVCNNSVITTIPFTTSNTGGVSTYNWSNIGSNINIGGPGFNVPSIPTFTASQNTTSLSTAQIVVTPTFSNAGLACIGSADTFQIHVIPSPTITPVSEQVYCNGNTTNEVNFTGTATNFNWSYIAPPNIGLNPTSGSGPIPSFTATNTDLQPVTVNVTATPVYNANNVVCTGPSTNFGITVNTTPLVDQLPDLVVCNGAQIASIPFTGNAQAFSWTINGSNIGITGSDTGNLPAFTAITGTAAVCVVPQYTAAGLICYGDTMCFQIIVNPTPVVNPISNVTICSEFNQPSIAFSGTATTFDWSVVGGNPVVGLTQPGGTGPIPGFISVDTPTEVSDQINVTPIFTANGVSCLGSEESFGILVLRKPVVDQLPDIEICNALCNDPIPFVGTGSSYVWSNSNNFIGLPGSGNGSPFPSFCATNTNPFTSISGTISYHPTYTENNVTCSGDTLQFLITVNPTPNVDPIDDIILCHETSSTGIAISGNATTYSWQIDNTSVGIGIPSNGNDFIPPFQGVNDTNDEVNEAVIVITPFFIGGGLDCPGANDTVHVIINPIPSIESVANQTLCFGSLSTEVIFEGTGTSYNWDLIGGGPSTIGLSDISGTDTLQVFTATNATNLPISENIEVTPVFTTANVSCFGTPTAFEIFVLPDPTVSQVTLASVCNQEPTVPVTYSGTYTSNTWSIAPNAALGINAAINDEDNLPSFTWTNSDNANPQAATITVTPSFEFNGLTCEGTAMVHAINVLPTTVVTPLPNLTFCNGDISSQFPIQATGTELEWTSAPPAGLAANGSSYFIPTFTATNTNTAPNAPSIVSTVTILPSYTDNLGLICDGTPSEFTITVHPTPVITPVSNYTVCNFGTVFQELETNIPSNISWSASPNAFITGETNTVVPSNIINEGLTNISPAPGTPQQTTYTVNAVSSPQGCSAAPMSFVINLMPTVTMSSTDFVQICNGNMVGIAFSSNVASNYSWIGSGPSGGVSNVPQPSPILNDVLTNPTNENQINSYVVTPTSIDGLCPGVPQTITVVVTPPPALISPPSASICSGQVVNYQFAANTSSFFTWFGQNNPNVDGVSLGVNQSPFITDTLFNETSASQTVVYNVVVTANASGNCSSPQIPVYITVHPLPVVVPEVKEICPDETVTFTLQATEPSSFTWWADNNLFVSGETTVQTQSNFISNTLTHSTYDPQFVYYNVTPTSLSTGCVGLTVQHTAIVNPLPDLSFTTSDILCTENPVTYTITPTTPLNVLWDLGNFVQSNQYSPTTYYDEPGEYVVALYGINPQTGCEDLVYVTIPILEAPPVDFITSSTKECVPAFFQFTNTANNPGSILTWNFGDGTTSNEQGVADHYYQEAGCFDVSLTAVAPNGCPNTKTYEEMVCAYNIPIAGFIVNDPIQYGDVNEFLFENVTVFGHTYFWDFGDGTTTTNAVHPGHIYPIERNLYNVVLIATNEAGCSDTAMVSIQVQERLIFYVPNSFTPDGNTRNEIFQPVFTAGYDIYTYELMIFNRWGEPMFESYNDKVGWDGTYGGMIMEDGTYVWRIRFKLLDDDDFQEYYGHVNLLR